MERAFSNGLRSESCLNSFLLQHPYPLSFFYCENALLGIPNTGDNEVMQREKMQKGKNGYILTFENMLSLNRVLGVQRPWRRWENQSGGLCLVTDHTGLGNWDTAKQF